MNWFSLCLSVSFHGKEVRSSPKRRSDGRLSRTGSTEKEPCGEGENKKEAEENKENMRLDEYYNDPDSWNESVISGESCQLTQFHLLDLFPKSHQLVFK